MKREGIRSDSIGFFFFLALYGATAFNFNLAWEYLQSASYFRHVVTEVSIWSMIFSALGDLCLVIGVYILMALFTRSLRWPHTRWNALTFVFFILFSAGAAIFWEIDALREGRWTYSTHNPVIPGLGISMLPVFQMSFLNPLSLILSKKLIPLGSSQDPEFPPPHETS